MSKTESKATDASNKDTSEEQEWCRTKGLQYVFDELIPEAANVLMGVSKN